MAVSDIRYQRLGYVALNVSDIAQSRVFYETNVGLTVDGQDDDSLLCLRCSDRHHDIVLYRGDPGLKRVAWQMESREALDAVHAEFTSLGLEITPVSTEETVALAIGDAFRITEPTTGVTFEFYVDMAPAPAVYVPTHTKIARLGHVVVNSADRPATEAFLLDHMNFRVSDRIDGLVSFMRCYPNPYHHSFGIGVSREDPALNHVNFMVSDLADIGRGNNRMKQADVPIVFGIGKHPPSESIFLYFLDPDGLTVEYSFGMEEFPEVAPRAPRDMPAKLESIDYWGGVPDPRSGKHGAIERLKTGV